MTAAAGAWRCFVGVPLPNGIREPLVEHVAEWRRELDAQWTDPAGWHCSLHFIGDVEPARVGALEEALAGAIGSAPRFMSVTGGLAAFPSSRRARVLYLGVADPDGHLERLAGRAAHAARATVGGDPQTRSFRGHVTLARLRRPERLDEWLARRDVPHGELDVTEACLMRSHLGHGPARYERLACFALAERAA